MHTRPKRYDDRFAFNPQYIFYALDWIEKNAAASSVYFAERKQFQSEISVGQLVNHSNLRRMISDDQISPHSKTEELLSAFTMWCWMFLRKLSSLEFTRSSS